ncbi:hypothetical protein ZHAS_00009821 [Anopheles sinensis]|uniref:Uncharacterized protein n=1 Tax=Anopheles sinensis TaxID=74873 RepID=A0A084VW13_ANOSI|nr:hypothetical protein ZHAS_00009821 [Anopheles sinensis]
MMNIRIRQHHRTAIVTTHSRLRNIPHHQHHNYHQLAPSVIGSGCLGASFLTTPSRGGASAGSALELGHDRGRGEVLA